MNSAMLIERWMNMPVMPRLSIQLSFDGPWTSSPAAAAAGASAPASSLEPGVRPSPTLTTGGGGAAAGRALAAKADGTPAFSIGAWEAPTPGMESDAAAGTARSAEAGRSGKAEAGMKADAAAAAGLAEKAAAFEAEGAAVRPTNA